MVTCEEEEVKKVHEGFIDMVNRGGLIKPLDIVYISCIHAWTLYSYVKKDEDLFKRLISSKNARSVFVRIFLRLLAEDTSTIEIVNQKCHSGCFFRERLRQIAVATFNIKAKNIISEVNGTIHLQRKRSCDAKHSAHQEK